MRRALPLLLLVACLPDTGGFGEGDAGVADDAGAGVDAQVPPGVDGGPSSSDVGPPRDAGPRQLGPGRCAPWPLACLDASGDDVLEIPTEASIAAVADAAPGTTIQFRGVPIGGQVRLPPYVTVRGCEGARLVESGTFWPIDGGGATIEGFEIAGKVIFDVTGTYLLRDNVFVGQTSPSESSVELRAIKPYTAAQVRVTVERNRFEGVPWGISIRTRYDVVENRVSPTIRNNLFDGVASPIEISEAGLMGYVSDALIEHNTFHDFDTAVRMFAVDRRIVLNGNLFVNGQTGVSTDTIFEGAGNMASGVETPANMGPLGGSIVAIPAPFVDPATGDFRLAPGSLAIDALTPTGVTEDLEGCPRPVAFSSDSPRSDVGALEAQVL